VFRAYNLTGDVHNVVTRRLVRVEDGRVAVDGRSFTAPAGIPDGEVRFGELREDAFPFGYDYNFDGDTTDGFAAVVAGGTRRDLTIWFDTDQDGSFANEDALRDWNASHRVTRLGRDKPDTAHVEEFTGFGVNLCQETGNTPCVTRAARLGDVWDMVTDLSPHGTPTASIAAGHDMRAFGETFDGVAPGAQVISLNASVARDDTLEFLASRWAAALLLGAEEGADVLTCGFLLSLADGGARVEALSQLVENLIAGYGVVVSVAAGNASHVQAGHFAPQTARNTIAVGASVTPTTFERNLRRPGIPSEGVRWTSASGPLADGGYHPDVLAPTSLLAAVPTWTPRQLDLLDYPAGLFPPGFRIAGGTSSSTPVVAGALAVLISAARQSRVRVTPHTLKRALELSGRRLRTTAPDQVIDVGHGLVQIDDAWRWLQRLGAEGAIDRDIDTVVDSEFSGPGRGQGIYQRNRFRPTERVTLTTSDPTARTYRLAASERWIRLDRHTVRLPGRGTAAFTVKLDPDLPDRPAVHSGVITVDDPTTRDPADHEMMVVIVIPTPLNAGNQLRVSGSGKTGIEAEKVRRHFFAVPPGATSLHVRSTTPAGASVGATLRVVSPGPDVFDQIAAITDPGPGRTGATAIENPKPGVWELWLHAHEHDRVGQPVLPRHPYDVTVTVQEPQR
jgi:subtilisin family serine protease